jgi:hypothetical protein
MERHSRDTQGFHTPLRELGEIRTRERLCRQLRRRSASVLTRSTREPLLDRQGHLDDS